MDITEFLAARLDEDEAAALAAADSSRSKHWRTGDNGIYGLDDVSHNPGPFLEDGSGHILEAVGAHIARWDPAHTLTEIELKRRLVTAFAGADRLSRLVGEVGEVGDNPKADRSISREVVHLILRALAAIYADHPDYDPQWRIE